MVKENFDQEWLGKKKVSVGMFWDSYHHSGGLDVGEEDSPAHYAQARPAHTANKMGKSRPA